MLSGPRNLRKFGRERMAFLRSKPPALNRPGLHDQFAQASMCAHHQKFGPCKQRFGEGLDVDETSLLASNTQSFRLISGMPAQVFISTDDRTVFSYLFKPISDQMRRAFVD
jgi:hypothetical protein